VIVIVALGGVLILLCAFINSLRCIQWLLSRQTKKQVTRRRRHRAVERSRPDENPDDAVDPSQLFPPPSYAEIVGEAMAPPPAYSALYVGDAGWESPHPTAEATYV
jgi:hypothetical protein